MRLTGASTPDLAPSGATIAQVSRGRGEKAETLFQSIESICSVSSITPGSRAVPPISAVP